MTIRDPCSKHNNVSELEIVERCEDNVGFFEANSKQKAGPAIWVHVSELFKSWATFESSQFQGFKR
jgi:hypothetical protein